MKLQSESTQQEEEEEEEEKEQETPVTKYSVEVFNFCYEA